MFLKRYSIFYINEASNVLKVVSLNTNRGENFENLSNDELVNYYALKVTEIIESSEKDKEKMKKISIMDHNVQKMLADDGLMMNYYAFLIANIIELRVLSEDEKKKWILYIDQNFAIRRLLSDVLKANYYSLCVCQILEAYSLPEAQKIYWLKFIEKDLVGNALRDIIIKTNYYAMTIARIVKSPILDEIMKRDWYLFITENLVLSEFKTNSEAVISYYATCINNTIVIPEIESDKKKKWLQIIDKHFMDQITLDRLKITYYSTALKNILETNLLSDDEKKEWSLFFDSRFARKTLVKKEDVEEYYSTAILLVLDSEILSHEEKIKWISFIDAEMASKAFKMAMAIETYYAMSLWRIIKIPNLSIDKKEQSLIILRDVISDKHLDIKKIIALTLTYLILEKGNKSDVENILKLLDSEKFKEPRKELLQAVFKNFIETLKQDVHDPQERKKMIESLRDMLPEEESKLLLSDIYEE